MRFYYLEAFFKKKKNLKTLLHCAQAEEYLLQWITDITIGGNIYVCNIGSTFKIYF